MSSPLGPEHNTSWAEEKKKKTSLKEHATLMTISKKQEENKWKI
jgi:hypothetical protein